MRSVPSGSFARLTSVEALWHAFVSTRRGKGRTAAMARFDLDADTEVLRLHRLLRAGTYRPDAHRLRVIQDPKRRLIAAPAVADRVVHRALIDEIAPTYERSFVPQSHAWGQGRGPQRAAMSALKWLRRTQFRLHLDVAKHFATVHLPTLQALLAHRLSDGKTLDLLRTCLEHGASVYQSPEARSVIGPIPEDRGLPLGSYLSQWCGGFVLNDLDHFVQRELHIGRYLRYLDDFVLFSDDREELAAARDRIARWLETERRQRLNRKKLDIVPTRVPWVFLGYRITRGGISASRKLRARMRSKIRKAAGHGPEVLRRTLVAYRGLVLWP